MSMKMKRIKLEKGLYRIGGVIARRVPGQTGRGYHAVATWREQPSGKIIGYTLGDVAEVAQAREKI